MVSELQKAVLMANEILIGKQFEFHFEDKEKARTICRKLEEVGAMVEIADFY